MDSRNALATCYWMFFPTPRSRAFFHAYSPMQKNVYVHFIHYEHTFGPGISSRSRAGCRSMHQADPMETLFSSFFHLYSYKFFTGGRPCGSSTRFRFFLATCAAGRPLVVHWRGCFFSLPRVDFCMTGFIYFFFTTGYDSRPVVRPDIDMYV